MVPQTHPQRTSQKRMALQRRTTLINKQFTIQTLPPTHCCAGSLVTSKMMWPSPRQQGCGAGDMQISLPTRRVVNTTEDACVKGLRMLWLPFIYPHSAKFASTASCPEEEDRGEGSDQVPFNTNQGHFIRVNMRGCLCEYRIFHIVYMRGRLCEYRKFKRIYGCLKR